MASRCIANAARQIFTSSLLISNMVPGNSPLHKILSVMQIYPDVYIPEILDVFIRFNKGL